MFDVGWPELLVIAIVLIVVVGPKDLPPMLRAFGRTTTKLRKMAGEFRGQFDEALREAELDEVRKTFSDARNLNPMDKIRDAVNPLKATGEEIRSGLEKSVKADTPDDKTASMDKDGPAAFSVPEPAMKLDDHPPVLAKASPADGATGAAARKSTGKTPRTVKKTAAKGGAPAKQTGKAPAKTSAKISAKAPAKTPTKAPAKIGVAAKAASTKSAGSAVKADDKPVRKAKARPVKDTSGKNRT